MPNPPDLTSDDYYKILGVEKSATEAQIKKAFRRLAIKYHPDKAKGDKDKATENFKKVSEAYEVLSDKEKRQQYDNFGKAGMNGQGFNFTNPNDIFSQFFGGAQGGDPFENMFSESFFTGQGRSPGGVKFSFSSNMGGPGGAQGMGGMPGGMPDIFADLLGGGGLGGLGGAFGQQGFGGMRQKRRTPTYDTLRPGTIVFVKNLKNQTYLNDYQGVIKSYERGKKRYLVEVDDVGEKSLKKENVFQLIKNITVINLKSKPELNGKKGLVFDCDYSKNRIVVRVNKQNLSLLCENIIFPKNTVLEIRGLKKGTQYNGRIGTVVDIDRSKQRYTLQLSATEKLSVSFKNVFP